MTILTTTHPERTNYYFLATDSPPFLADSPLASRVGATAMQFARQLDRGEDAVTPSP